MKTPTKKTLIKKLDTVMSQIVRSRGVCAKCGKGAEQVTLQCAHIFSRRNMSVRFDLRNLLALCYACHFHWAHKEPIQFYEFIEQYLGEYEFSQLKIRARGIVKWSIEDLQTLLGQMEKLRDGY